MIKFRAVAVLVLACGAAFGYPLSTAASAAGVVDHAMREAQNPLGAGAPITPKYRYFFSPTARWAGALHWKYNHANAPSSLAGNKAGVIAQLTNSLDRWTAQCGITYAYDGETTVAPNNVVNDPVHGPQPDGASVVGWGPLDASLGGWTYDWYVQNNNQRVIIDADITLSVTNIKSTDDVDRLMTHEWGHALGLDHSNVELAVMAGPPMTHYNSFTTLQPDDVRGCRCQYGLPPSVSAAYACALPDEIDFGAVAIGVSSAPQSVTLTNSGNVPLLIKASTVTNAQFKHIGGCQQGTSVPPGGSCTLQVQATPATTGDIAGQLTLTTNDGDYPLPLQATGVQVAGPAAVILPTVDVVEFYNATLDHYFITWIAAEIFNLDAGITPTRWTRTGKTFKAYTTALAGTSEVCRLYIPPAVGDSHFFGRSSAECNASRQAHPEFVLEDPSYMQVYLPTMGTCPSGSQPVYRLFNGRRDTNHRYVTTPSTRDQMVAAGWIAEGDGPDLVAMCVPAQ
jgi:hypothetical protein